MEDQPQVPAVNIIDDSFQSLQASKDELIRKMRITAGCRFRAAQRLEENEQKQTKLSAYASSGVIIITILPNFFDLHQFIISLIGITTVGLSIIILVSTLIQFGASQSSKAVLFHRCAMDVKDVQYRLISRPPSMESLKEASDQYSRVLKSYPINHDQSDYDHYKKENSWDFPSEDKSVSKNESRSKKDKKLDVYMILTTTILGATAALSVLSAAPDLSVFVYEFIEQIKLLLHP